MLKKLITYEYKASFRLTSLLLLAILGISLLMRFSLWCFSSFQLPFPLPAIFTVVCTLTVAAFVVSIFLYIGFRFFRNLLEKEGYLTHTLPVPVWMLWLSKLLVHYSYGVFAFLFFLFFLWLNLQPLQTEKMTAGFSYDAFLEIVQMFQGPLPALFHLCFLFLSSLLSTISMIYAALSIGSLFSRYRIPASVGTFLILYTILELVFIIVLRKELAFLASPDFAAGAAQTGKLFFQAAGLDLGAACIYLFLTHLILQKHLNLV